MPMALPPYLPPNAALSPAERERKYSELDFVKWNMRGRTNGRDYSYGHKEFFTDLNNTDFELNFFEEWDCFFCEKNAFDPFWSEMELAEIREETLKECSSENILQELPSSSDNSRRVTGASHDDDIRKSGSSNETDNDRCASETIKSNTTSFWIRQPVSDVGEIFY